MFRSNWDYHHAPEDFLAWLARWEAAGVRFWNPPDLVRWNLSKRYLRDLERAGVPVVPTASSTETSPTRLPALLAARGWETAVVKPLLSASAHDTVLVRPAGSGARWRAPSRRAHPPTPAMVQPFVEEIRSRGEWSLVFIDGTFTHAALKRPAPATSASSRASAAAPPPRGRTPRVAAGRRALDALPVPPLYVRVDGVETAARLPGDGSRGA